MYLNNHDGFDYSHLILGLATIKIEGYTMNKGQY